MLKKNEFGWYYLVCDYCGASFGMDDILVRTNREETMREARKVGWKVGAKTGTYCNAHRNLSDRGVRHLTKRAPDLAERCANCGKHAISHPALECSVFIPPSG